MDMTGDRFLSALRLLPPQLRRDGLLLPSSDRQRAEEIRLRSGCRPSVALPEGERQFSCLTVTQELLRSALETATASSVHSSQASLSRGYVTARGGYRVGIAGSAIMQGGCCTGFRSISGLCIRISRQMPGVAEDLLHRMGGAAGFKSALIISPPGGGKTTLLRDMVRLLSHGGRRVALCDERGEVAAMWDGEPCMDVGPCTDVMEGCPRDMAIEMLLRSMCPQILAVDEITAQQDADALCQAVGCGVQLLATAHAANVRDLRARPMYSRLLQSGVFDCVITIISIVGHRNYSITKTEAAYA